MYPKIVSVLPNDDYTLKVIFSDEKVKLYDMKPLLNQNPFQDLKNNNLFFEVQVDVGGYGISWNDFIDLSEYELYINSIELI
ncbi:MAG: DUF2442 domain-containing protein [Paraclostridium sp.]